MKGKLIILFWFLGISFIISMLHSWHLIEFRSPAAEKLAPHLALQDENSLSMTHFLAADCSCSKHLLNYFMERGRHQNTPEKVVLIGAAPKEERILKELGFSVEKISIEEAKKSEAFSAVPLLIIHSGNEVIYTGGYTKGSISPLTRFLDLEVLEAIKNNQSISSFPIKGCAVAQTFQKTLDPLGLKYRNIK